MNVVLPVLILVGILAAAGLTVLAMVTAGVHSEERHLSLSGPPRTRAEILARWLLDTHVSGPDALRVLGPPATGHQPGDSRRSSPAPGIRRPAGRTFPGRSGSRPATGPQPPGRAA